MATEAREFRFLPLRIQVISKVISNMSFISLQTVPYAYNYMKMRLYSWTRANMDFAARRQIKCRTAKNF